MDKDWTQPMWLSQPHKYENFASNIKHLFNDYSCYFLTQDLMCLE